MEREKATDQWDLPHQFRMRAGDPPDSPLLCHCERPKDDELHRVPSERASSETGEPLERELGS